MYPEGHDILHSLYPKGHNFQTRSGNLSAILPQTETAAAIRGLPDGLRQFTDI